MELGPQCHNLHQNWRQLTWRVSNVGLMSNIVTDHCVLLLNIITKVCQYYDVGWVSPIRYTLLQWNQELTYQSSWQWYPTIHQPCRWWSGRRRTALVGRVSRHWDWVSIRCHTRSLWCPHTQSRATRGRNVPLEGGPGTAQLWKRMEFISDQLWKSINTIT